MAENEEEQPGFSRETAVGYGKPPVEHRFAPGNTEHLKARGVKKRNGYHIVPKLKKLLAEIAPQDKKGRTWGELLAEATLINAMKGNGTAIKEVFNRIEGLQERPIEPPPPANRNNFEAALIGAAEEVWAAIDLEQPE